MKNIYTPLKTPKAHQMEAVEQLIFKNKANFDDQGLGKCKQAYDLAGKLFETGQIDLVILISKASLRSNFLKEINGDAHQLVARIISGDRRERALAYLYPSAHFLILSYETVISDLAALRALMEKNRVLLCLDEAHYIKNSSAHRSKACLELAKFAHRAVVFTGTPAPNKPEDLYAQLKFIGLDVGDNVQDFRDRFSTLELLRDFLKLTSIRRKKETLKNLNLPQKTIHKISVKLSASERVAYDNLNEYLLLKVRNTFGKTSKIHIDNILTKLLRLVQFTSNHRMLDADVIGVPSKLQALDELVKELVHSKKKKLIIWTNFKKNVEELVERYSKYNALPLYGPLGRETIGKNAVRFQEDGKTKILIAIPACAREGFTFTSAHNAVYLDRNFSYLDWAQSQDRIHRISQTNPCNIYVLEATDTIDERIDEVLTRKGHMQGYLLGDTDEYHGSEIVSFEEVRDLTFGLKKKAENISKNFITNQKIERERFLYV